MGMWHHQDFGKFEHDGSAWVRKIALPAFKSFTYAEESPRGRYDLAFETDDEEEMPSTGMVSVAKRVIDNAMTLAEKVVTALWDDFNGRGPKSGMWWRGDLDQVAQNLEGAIFSDELAAPTKPQDLRKLLGLSSVNVRAGVDGHEKPVAELSFAAAFEVEHGVGILTDGRSILGIGYGSDVTPFKKTPAPRRRGRSR